MTIDGFLATRNNEQILRSTALDLLCKDVITLEQYLELIEIVQDPEELEAFFGGM